MRHRTPFRCPPLSRASTYDHKLQFHNFVPCSPSKGLLGSWWPYWIRHDNYRSYRQRHSRTRGGGKSEIRHPYSNIWWILLANLSPVDVENGDVDRCGRPTLGGHVHFSSARAQLGWWIIPNVFISWRCFSGWVSVARLAPSSRQ